MYILAREEPMHKGGCVRGHHDVISLYASPRMTWDYELQKMTPCTAKDDACEFVATVSSVWGVWGPHMLGESGLETAGAPWTVLGYTEAYPAFLLVEESAERIPSCAYDAGRDTIFRMGKALANRIPCK